MGARRATQGGGDRRRRWLGAALAVLSAASVVIGAMPARAEDELSAALRRKQELERAIEVTRRNAERYQTVAGQYQSAVNAANERIADLAAQQASARSEGDALGFEIKIAEEQLQLVSFQLGETRAFVESLGAQGDELDRQLARRQELYADHLRAAYRQVQVTPLEMLLSSSSLTEFASRLQATVLLNRQDAQLAADIHGLRAETARKQGDLAGKQSEILGLQDQITTQRERLAMEKARYDDLVRQADAAIVSQSSLRADAATNKSQAQRNAQQAAAEAARLNKQLEEAEAAYEELAARLAARSGLGAFDGTRVAIWPIRGPSRPVRSALAVHNGSTSRAEVHSVRAVSAASSSRSAGLRRGGRHRDRRHHRPREQLLHALRAPRRSPLAAGAGWADGERRRRHRLRRHDRLDDRAAPPLHDDRAGPPATPPGLP